MMKLCYIIAHTVVFVLAQIGTYWFSYDAFEGNPGGVKWLMIFIGLTMYVLFATFVYAKETK